MTPSGTKIAHAVGDLSRYAGESPERLEDVLHTLSDERVVRALPSRNGGGARYEIYHDVLADAVLAWGARHEADRALAEERAAARGAGMRRLAAIGILALLGAALMTVVAAYAIQQRDEAERQARRAEVLQAKAERETEAAKTARAASTRSEQKAQSGEQSSQGLGADCKEGPRPAKPPRQRRRAGRRGSREQSATSSGGFGSSPTTRARTPSAWRLRRRARRTTRSRPRTMRRARNDAIVAKNDALEQAKRRAALRAACDRGAEPGGGGRARRRGDLPPQHRPRAEPAARAAERVEGIDARA